MANDLADRSVLYIYADGPKADATVEVKARIAEVRALIREKPWCKTVHINESDTNKGLANSVILGVSEILNQYGKAIVLEDDLLSTKDFLRFMNMSLETYEHDNRIFSISGYRYPGIVPANYKKQIFLFPRASSWGWATWQDRWQLADWDLRELDTFLADKDAQGRFNRGGKDLADMLIMQVQGKIDSWAIRWCYTHFINNAFGLFPVKSRIKNIGLDGSGIHCKPSDKSYGELEYSAEDIVLPKKLKTNETMIQNHAAFFSDNYQAQTTAEAGERSFTMANMKRAVKKILRKTGYDVVRYRPTAPVVTGVRDEVSAKDIELERLKALPRYQVTQTNLFGDPFKIVDTLSFYYSYKEIFEQEIYRFHVDSASPLIIDGGSNVGTSILFFKKLYPHARIIGFEADPAVYKILQENIANFQLVDVILYNCALWNSEGTMAFMSEGADGGRIISRLSEFNTVAVKTVRLAEFLTETVDFLKLDIEGAEVDVLTDSADSIDRVKNIFIEYHSFQDQPQRLDELLSLLRRAGFRYQIHAQFASPKPLLSRTCQLGMDLQLNIFGYRE